MQTRLLFMTCLLGAVACGTVEVDSDLGALDLSDESLSTARCTVVPNSVTLGAAYNVQISGAGAGKPLTVMSREANGTARANAVTADATGAAQTSFVSVSVGGGQVGVSAWRRHRNSVIARCTFTVVADTTLPPPPPPPPSCGDNACLGDETCASCTADCGACLPQCGDGTCGGGETCSSCSTDCGACTTYTKMVGPGQQFTTLAAAIAASRDGDHIGVMAGTYTNDFSTIRTKVTISGVGGLAHFNATISPPNGKGILLTQSDVTLERLEFSGASVADGNGAGVRFEGGNLVVTHCYFHGNEMNMLGGEFPGSVDISYSEFGATRSSSLLNHSVYMGHIPVVRVADSYFHDTFDGHHIKSRAYQTTIENNRLVDGTGAASYNIDLPEGGVAVVRNNVIEQGASTDNLIIIHYGGEAGPHSPSSLLVEGNVLQNLASSATGVANQTAITVTLQNNSTYHVPTLTSGPATTSGTTTLSAPVLIDKSAPY